QTNAASPTYEWTGPAGFSDPGSVPCIGNLSLAGHYHVKVTDGVTGCSDTCGFTLVKNNPPTCSVTGRNSICAGDTTHFCVSTNASQPTFEWTGPGGPIAGNVSCIGGLSAAGHYHVTVTDGVTGCSDTCGRTLSVTPKPECTITPSS